MARTDSLSNYLTDVAQAIKDKKGDQTEIIASNFDTEIANLPSGGGEPETVTVDVTLSDVSYMDYITPNGVKRITENGTITPLKYGAWRVPVTFQIIGTAIEKWSTLDNEFGYFIRDGYALFSNPI